MRLKGYLFIQTSPYRILFLNSAFQRFLIFTTNTSSMRVAQYGENNHACIYFCDTRFFRGAMLRGTMEVLTDSASKEMIWQEGDTMYYPEGVTDPDYCVLKFTAILGRFYSSFKSEDFVNRVVMVSVLLFCYS